LAAADKLMDETIAHFGRIDVLVNVVGGTIWWQPFHLYTQEQIMLELERSLHTALWCCRAALPHMIRQKGGSIVNLGSSVTRGALYRVPYAVCKGGVEALTRTLAAENGRYGIRVNAVSPGSTTSPDRVTSRLTIKPGEVADEAEDTKTYFEETRRLKNRAIDRQGASEEQAAAIAFLASDDASYITGQIINCDGGSA
jgi:NAD(P)-dependent dehydrogenase (short-subunit alcohol dehydrogenase family)